MVNLKRIADKLSEEMDRNNEDVNFTSSFIGRRSNDVDFDKAYRLKDLLLDEYSGKNIEDVFPVNDIQNQYGCVYDIVNEFSLNIDLEGKDVGLEEVYNDLKLIEGIGPVTEEKLKSEGYNSIKDLLDHEKWNDKAEHFLQEVACDEYKLYECITRWKKVSDPLLLNLVDNYEPEDFVIFDVESLGLFGRPIILFGIARPVDGKIVVNQLLVDEVSNEPAALVEARELLSDRVALLTFNGKTFDVPYLKQRLNFYGLDDSGLNFLHFDLLHFSRNKWNNMLRDCTLETIEEEVLNIDRDVDIPSSLVPEFFRTYRENNNVGPLVPLIEHNKQDLLSLVHIFHSLTGDECD